MSFAIALDQVTRKLWREDYPTATRTREEKPEITARRKSVLEYLRRAGKKVSTDELMEAHDSTRQQIRYVLERLIEFGTVVQHKPKHDLSLWEAV